MNASRQHALVPGLLALCLLLLACESTGGDSDGLCSGALPPEIERPTLDLQHPGVSRHNLRAWVELFTSPQLKGRHAGTDSAREAAAVVAAQMARVGLVPSRRVRGASRTSVGEGYCRGFPLFDAQDFNVIGALPRLPPSGGATVPVDDQPAILISAHYDGQGVHPAGMIYPGADDNASGVAALLEVARLVARQSSAPTADLKVDWIFVAFGAEESGQQGAWAYLSSPTVTLKQVALAVNIDMIGRPYPGSRADAIGYQVLGTSMMATRTHLEAAVAAAGLELRPLETSGELMPAISDAQVLAKRLPTLLLSTALHADHHQLTDTADRIDYGQIERAVCLVLTLGDILAAL